MTIRSINPATGETLRTFEPPTDRQVDDAVGRAAAAFRDWRRTPFAERSRLMLQVAARLEEDPEYPRLMTLEMGKTIAAARAEVAKCATACRYYAEHAARFLADETVETGAAASFVRYQPIGPVLAVMPWNFPFWQVIRFAAPALMAGNVGLLKHASNVPQCALALEDLFRKAGFPEGVFTTLLVGAEGVARVLDDPRVAAATLTGSEGAGREVASRAGRNIKKTVLELGGSDPFVVLPSADLDAAVATAVEARTINNGQSCIAAKRFIVHEEVAARFTDAFVARMEGLRIGDPMAETTDVGPLATAAVRDGLDRQVRESVAAGARVLTGGRALPDRGFYYSPTVLADVAESAPAFREELFGPVASLFVVKDTDQAIRLANATTFGLGSSVWTTDPAEQARLVDEIEAGQVFVNAMVASDPRLPFGGVKRSGYGRELAWHGIREFVNAKTVWVAGRSGERREARTE
ncbi:MAG TPA: NAD-dependent succinate-semialdehyde dehydrogenase [Thermodesulfobacteriota bacterium]